jgi:transitional endoplasmic reticulum ATPase
MEQQQDTYTDGDGKKKKMKAANVEIAHKGTSIVLPVIDGKPMSTREARKWLERKEIEEESFVAVHNVIRCSPLDGLVAFQRILRERYGWSEGVTKKSWFGDHPPVMLGVPTGPHSREQAMYGYFKVPGVEGEFQTKLQMDPPAFIIAGNVKKKHEDQVRALVGLVEERVKSDSIYKGKAIRIDFSWDRPNSQGEKKGYDPLNDAPQFMELNPALEETLIFGEKVAHALNVGLFYPIEYADACRQNGVPLGRRAILAGSYGTGKTLTATVTAIKGVRNGWTFVYLSDVRDLKRGLEFAAHYAPSILFAEDVDRVTSGPRSISLDEILNTLSGVDTGQEVITAFTTNHVESINEAMLRPGRTDVLVEVTAPDADAASRLVALYSRGLLEANADLKHIGERLEGHIPATIREVVERGKIAAIGRLKGGNIVGAVSEADLLDAADAMENHMALVQGRNKATLPREVTLTATIPPESDLGEKLLDQVRSLNGAKANGSTPAARRANAK